MAEWYERFEDNAMEGEIDLGHSHYLRFYRHGDDDETSTYRNEDGTDETISVADQPHLANGDGASGAIVRHRANTETGWCEGGFGWWSPPSRPDGQAKWTLESLEPLTVSPSILCSCGDHGFVKEGKWVPA